jgi:hypothetical protein
MDERFSPMSLTVADRTTFWDRSRKHLAQDQFKRGAIVKFIVENQGVWVGPTYVTSRWILRQIMLINSGDDLSKPMFLPDPDHK